MRQAINNLQSTWSGFGFISSENVFKVCDQPHPIVIQSILEACQKSDIDTAMEKIQQLWDQGYSGIDIVVTIFRVVKASDKMPEYTKLEFIKVRCCILRSIGEPTKPTLKEIGWTHMRVLEGVGTLVQLGGLMARLCKVVRVLTTWFFLRLPG